MSQQSAVVQAQVRPLSPDGSPNGPAPSPATLILHLQRKHSWRVSFAGWYIEDLVALHNAEHDEQVNPERPEPPKAA